MVKKKPKLKPQLLRWSEKVPASDVTDPLGLGLRGSTRLASLLLFCITSITPRARYFSFIPWCIQDYQKREKERSFALGLKEAIKLREKALTYGCVIHHDGQPCKGGSLVGSSAAQDWLVTRSAEVKLKQVPFAKNPALDAYLNSLINLGFFVEQGERAEVEDVEESELTFNNVELSDLGTKLATSYDSVVRRLEAVRRLSEAERTCSVASLKKFGERGGLCELADPKAPERTHLRDVFFARSGLMKKSHFRRNRSLVLMLELSRQFSLSGRKLNESNFGSAVYYGKVIEEGEPLEISIPVPLLDIATRWRMFYFHHYLGVALEGMFSWLVTQLANRGLAGASLRELSEDLCSSLVSRSLREHFDQAFPKDFGASSPSELFRVHGISESDLTAEISQQIDAVITAESSIAELWLEEVIRDGTYRHSSVGLAVPCILFVLTLARYKRWEETEYGSWLASDAVVKDPYLDLLPSTISLSLLRHQSDWWSRPWTELAQFVLSRFVVQQHQSMAYVKTAAGDRCLLEVDGERVLSDSVVEKIGLGNPRLGSAIQILTDLALLAENDDGTIHVTQDGLNVLQSELERAVEA